VPLLLAERPGATVALEPGALVELRPLIEAMGARCQSCTGNFSSFATTVRDFRAIYAGGDTGRHWFLKGYANCDALLVAGHVLKAMDRTDEPFSQLAAS
jgi:hypothetical protein